jgi:hypothetical protein
VNSAGINVDLGAASRIVDVNPPLRTTDFDFGGRRFVDSDGRHLLHGRRLTLIAAGKGDRRQSHEWQNSHGVVSTNG